jgi:hypothetical protein
VIIESWSTVASGTELPLKLQMNDCESVSSPIGVKIMKARNIRVGYYLVTKQTPGQPDNTADFSPQAAALQYYLNAVFLP